MTRAIPTTSLTVRIPTVLLARIKADARERCNGDDKTAVTKTILAKHYERIDRDAALDAAVKKALRAKRRKTKK